MILDPYISQVIGQCDEARLLLALREIYDDIDWDEDEVMPELAKWKRKALQRPGVALSTGRRNSLSGMVTCALLHCLEVSRPKGARTRMQLAWAVLDSEEGKRVTGDINALGDARKERDQHWAWGGPDPR